MGLFDLAKLDLELGVLFFEERLVIVKGLVELHDEVDVSLLLL